MRFSMREQRPIDGAPRRFLDQQAAASRGLPQMTDEARARLGRLWSASRWLLESWVKLEAV